MLHFLGEYTNVYIGKLISERALRGNFSEFSFVIVLVFIFGESHGFGWFEDFIEKFTCGMMENYCVIKYGIFFIFLMRSTKISH